MTRTDHLLVIAAEECNEVAQRITKSLRFGLEEVQPGMGDCGTNAERILSEYAHLLAVMRMLVAEKALPVMDLEHLMQAKIAQVEKFLLYSEECGRLEEECSQLDG